MATYSKTEGVQCRSLITRYRVDQIHTASRRQWIHVQLSISVITTILIIALNDGTLQLVQGPARVSINPLTPTVAIGLWVQLKSILCQTVRHL